MENFTAKVWNGYYVFEDGSVFSLKSNQFIKPYVNKDGYYVYTLYVDGIKKSMKVHRLVAMLYLDLPENYENLTVDHLNGDKSNNHYSNLEWVTRKENNRRAVANGLNNPSENMKKRWDDNDYKEYLRERISDGMRRNKKNE